MQAHVSPQKKALVERLAGEFQGARVVGIVNVAGIPAAQLQAMRSRLRGRVSVTVAKKTLLRIALEQAGSTKAGLAQLADLLDGQAAVVTASVNPFKLYKEMESTKTPAPAKGGEVAPADIEIQEGETPFKPGPIVGELQKAGIPAAIDKGKVVIKKAKLLVKKGDRIPRDMAQAMTRLEIFPLVVGMDLRGAFEEGTVYRRDVLAVDEVRLLADMGLAHAQARSLSVAAAFPTAETTSLLVATAHQRAIALALTAGFPTKATVELLLARAHAQAAALAAKAGFS
jgi:large subunit ribosomal protein L10